MGVTEQKDLLQNFIEIWICKSNQSIAPAFGMFPINLIGIKPFFAMLIYDFILTYNSLNKPYYRLPTTEH